MAGDAPRIINEAAAGAGAAAAAFGFTEKVRQIRIRNLHATQTITAVASVSGTSAAAAKTKAGVAPNIAVIGADDNWVIPALSEKVIWKSAAKGFYAAISVIASGASTGFVAEGTIWTDGN